MSGTLPDRLYICQLARDSGVSESLVVAIYEHELGTLMAKASIQTYVPLLVIKRVKQRLRQLSAAQLSIAQLSAGRAEP